MSVMEPKDYPEKLSSGDLGRAIVIGGISAVPQVGGLIGELISLYWSGPLDKRRAEWFNGLNERMKVLEVKDGLSWKERAEDPEFQTVLIQATVAAIQTHHEEKLVALRNVVIQSALEQGQNYLHLLFVRFIDTLSPIHLQLLKELKARDNQIQQLDSYQKIFDLLQKPLGISMASHFKLLCTDLHNLNLTRFSEALVDFSGLATKPSLLAENNGSGRKVIVTDLGVEFLEYISSVEG